MPNLAEGECDLPRFARSKFACKGRMAGGVITPLGPIG